MSVVNQVLLAALVHPVHLDTLELVDIEDLPEPVDFKVSRANRALRELLAPLDPLVHLEVWVLLARMDLLGGWVRQVLAEQLGLADFLDSLD